MLYARAINLTWFKSRLCFDFHWNEKKNLINSIASRIVKWNENLCLVWFAWFTWKLLASHNSPSLPLAQFCVQISAVSFEILLYYCSTSFPPFDLAHSRDDCYNPDCFCEFLKTKLTIIIRCYRETLTEMDLQTSLAEAQLAVDYFFNNKFAEAKQLMEPW